MPMRRRHRVGRGVTTKRHSSVSTSKRAQRRTIARSKQRLRNANTTAGASRAWQADEKNNPPVVAVSPDRVPQIMAISPPSARKLVIVPKKHIQRESDHLVRIKQGLKDKILIMNASMANGGSRDYYSFGKKFREMDLNSDGRLDWGEFKQALGPTGMNLGLPKRDVRLLFNEFADGGEEINVKQFFAGMADLDRPDLDLVTVLSEYKGRALTTLLNRLRGDDDPATVRESVNVNMEFYDSKVSQVDEGSLSNDNMEGLRHNEETANTREANGTQREAGSRGRALIRSSLSLPQLRTSGTQNITIKSPTEIFRPNDRRSSPIRAAYTGNLPKSFSWKALTELRPSGEQQMEQKQRTEQKLFKLNNPQTSPIRRVYRSPVRILAPLEEKNQTHQIVSERPPILNTISPEFNIIDEISQFSKEAETLAQNAIHCSRGWFSGKRTLRKSPVHGSPQVNVLVHESWDRFARNRIINSETARHAHKEGANKTQSSDTTAEFFNTANGLTPPSWVEMARKEHAKHLERTAEPKSGGIKHKRRSSSSYIPRLQAEYEQRQNEYHRRQINRVLGRTRTRSAYEEQLLALQEAEIRKDTKDGSKGGVRCEYAMRTKAGNAASPCLW